MLFDPGFTDVLRNVLPGLGDFFLLISQIGGELFYIGLLLIGFWTYNKRESILATYILVAAVLTNYWLKYVIAIDRPPSGNWYPGADAPNYSTPSGHSQNSATLFGWFTVKAKTWWMAVVGIVLTVLIGISRIYLGVHYLGDVLLGWGLGIVFVLVFFYLENPMREYISRYKTENMLLLMAIMGFVITLIASLLPQPPNDNFGSYGGLTIGLALGLILEMRFVNFSTEPHEGQKWRLFLRVIIGLVLVVGLILGLSPILPSADIWLRMIRYFLAALVGIFVWPFIFKRANL
ncbi:MAG: phosphatase PAP2 family protein [Candidatus Thorarchaeota archaeon]|jgi:membrane-associated phospholipid phosphatase